MFDTVSDPIIDYKLELDIPRKNTLRIKPNKSLKTLSAFVKKNRDLALAGLAYHFLNHSIHLNINGVIKFSNYKYLLQFHSDYDFPSGLYMIRFYVTLSGISILVHTPLVMFTHHSQFASAVLTLYEYLSYLFIKTQIKFISKDWFAVGFYTKHNPIIEQSLQDIIYRFGYIDKETYLSYLPQEVKPKFNLYVPKYHDDTEITTSEEEDDLITTR